MCLLIYNTKNPVGLEINMEGIATEAWKSYKDGYKVASDMACQNAEQDLRATTYTKTEDFPIFTSVIRNKWAQINSLGVGITNKNFKTIIINALPHLWNPIVASIFKDMPLSNAILNTWWIWIS